MRPIMLARSIFGGRLPGDKGNGAIAVHGLSGIDDDIHEHVTQLLRVGHYHGNEGRHLFPDGDVMEKRLVLDEVDGAVNGHVDVLRLHELAGLPGELEQLLDGVPAPLGVLENPV